MHSPAQSAVAHRLIFGECDCCAKPNRVLHRGEASGLEVYACAECHYGKLAEDAGGLLDEIERLLPLADDGAKSAHICALEAAYVEATGEQVPV